ncbi:MAG: family 43 glycosylhydrolase [Prevotellaceae bacterium]|jgi:predicted GH43/DUF377 family glycosyl hydrolase|nr:family 43 glycosylhydrolase [Prevotellaceae bacterium]
MNTDEIISKLQKIKPYLQQEYVVKTAGLFGSCPSAMNNSFRSREFFVAAVIFLILSTNALLSAQSLSQSRQTREDPLRQMMFADSTRNGRPYAKDPHVIFFQQHYLMYYSIPPFGDSSNPVKGWGIGVARSKNLIDWERVGEIIPSQACDAKGLCAPCAIVIDGKVHLFYQTYGNREKDAICHATSTDGVSFDKNPSNPVFSPSGAWTCGRAIDAEVICLDGQCFMYYATRDPEFRIQMLGVAVAGADFSAGQWTNLSTEHPVLAPELSWEEDCIEGASLIRRNGKLYMFYAGAYNNRPQQIGVAVSDEGIRWTRLSDTPFLRNGAKGEWNHSESGHPHIFEAPDGRTFLFFQGNNDKGNTWYISNVEIFWSDKGPYMRHNNVK